jgi:uncharacterized membrane-anchored protein YhcB (DUF1043 family)
LNDIQILTAAIAITFPVLGIVGAIVAVIYSGKRLDEMKTDTSKRLDELKTDTSKRLDEMKTELMRHMDNGFEHMELLLKLHEVEHHKK